MSGIGAVSVADALDSATIAIRAAGSPSARLDAELLLADAMGGSRERLIREPEAPLESAAARTFRAHVSRRSTQREPIAYIVGRRAFRRLEIGVDARVLVPRPETELLVELAAATLASGARVLDCCCGSGAVALALKDERGDLIVSGSDLDRGALEVAAANSARLGLEIEWLRADLLAGLDPGRYHAVVANPPDVPSGEIAGLEPEVSRHEPRLALDGGQDGLPGAPAARRAGRGRRRADADHRARRGTGGRRRGPLPRRPPTLPRAAIAIWRQSTARWCSRAAMHALPRSSPHGGIAVIGTDTVYGVCADALDDGCRGAPAGAQGPARGQAGGGRVRVRGPPGARRSARARRTQSARRCAGLLPGPLTLLGAEPGAALPARRRRAARHSRDRRPRRRRASARCWSQREPRRGSGGTDDYRTSIRRSAPAPTSRSTAGELPGTPSTIVDLGAFEEDGQLANRP